jgi:RNA polymerase sigma factor (sigma-70 family)
MSGYRVDRQTPTMELTSGVALAGAADRAEAGTVSRQRSSRRAASIDRDTLYAEFQPLVRRLIRQYGRTPELRADLEGEIYCRFCGFLDAYDPERGIPLRPYMVRQLTASTYTYTRQYWRVAAREYALLESEVDNGFGDEEDPTDNWLQSICQQQVAEGLPAAMERLPERQRNVVIWRYYEDRSFDEIATFLGVQSATVRSLLRHGLNNLRKYIGAPDAE